MLFAKGKPFIDAVPFPGLLITFFFFGFITLSFRFTYALFSCVSSSASSPFSWISVLQNSKEEALNNAFKGDQHVGENNIVQELTKAILGEVKRMTGNDVCCDCGAPGE